MSTRKDSSARNLRRQEASTAGSSSTGGRDRGEQQGELPPRTVQDEGESASRSPHEVLMSTSQREIPLSEIAASLTNLPEEEMLRAFEREIEQRVLAKNSSAASASAASSSPLRVLQSAQEASKKSPDAATGSGTSQGSPSRTVHGDQEPTNKVPKSSDISAGTSRSSRGRVEPVALTRSQYAATMQSALARIKKGDVRDEGEAFTEMEQALTGLLEITYRKVKPELPYEFLTKWPHSDDDPLRQKVMVDPVILASGLSVDELCRQWFSPNKNMCPVTNQLLAHSLLVPDQLLRNMISEWCLDHSISLPSATAGTCSMPSAPPLKEKIPELLENLSRHKHLQAEALHLIQLLSKTSKGAQPSLDKWPNLLPLLIDIQKKWKSTWEPDHEEERIKIILNLSVHRPNREILAGETKLPGALKLVIQKADTLGTSASCLAMVASAIAILSEFKIFRSEVLKMGGMAMLGDLLKIEDVVVKKEAGAAILALCADGSSRVSAIVDGVPNALLECLTGAMVTDECLLLLDHLKDNMHVLDGIFDRAEQLANVIMAEHVNGLVTSRGVYSAISLIHFVVVKDVVKMKNVKNLKDFKIRLLKLSLKGMPFETLCMVDGILSTLSMKFPDHPAVRR